MVEIIEQILERLLNAPAEMAIILTLGAIVLSGPVVFVVVFLTLKAFREPALEALRAHNRREQRREEDDLRREKRRAEDEERLAAERDRFQARVAALEEEFRALRDQLEESQANYLKATEENKGLREKTSAMEDKLEALQKLAAEAEQLRKNESEAKAKELSTLQEANKLLLETLTRREKDHAVEIMGWQSRLLKYELEIKQLQERIAQLEAAGAKPLPELAAVELAQPEKEDKNVDKAA